jgi:hypothetical protein
MVFFFDLIDFLLLKDLIFFIQAKTTEIQLLLISAGAISYK